MREALGLLGRFGLVGLLNTAVGFAVVVLLDPILGLPPALANAASYAVGLAVGFLLSRGFVFRSRTALSGAGVRYAIAALAAFALNQGVLQMAGKALGGGTAQHITAQLLAMAVYSVSFFVLCQLWVFRLPAGSSAT